MIFQPLSTIQIIVLIVIILSLLCTLMIELLSGTFFFGFMHKYKLNKCFKMLCIGDTLDTPGGARRADKRSANDKQNSSYVSNLTFRAFRSE